MIQENLLNQILMPPNYFPELSYEFDIIQELLITVFLYRNDVFDVTLEQFELDANVSAAGEEKIVC